MRTHLTTFRVLKPILLLHVAAIASTALSGNANAAIGWDGGGNSNWWFDPVNWSRDADVGGPFLPPSQGQPVANTDAQINIGTSGAWNVTGEGVVYDPDNDPFFAAAASLAYPTGSPLSGLGYGDYGPQHLYRMYIGRNVTNGDTNLLTIKSGDLVMAGTYVVGRSGSTAGNENLGIMVQEGGRFRIPLDPLDIGQAETSGWGNGRYEYRGGILEIGIDGLDPIRVAHGGGNGLAGGRATFVVHNPTSGGHVRGWAYQSASWRGSVNATLDAADPDGIGRGTALTQFHYENGGTRPIQVAQNLSINNGFQTDTQGTVSSLLDLVLHETACTGAGCVPNDLGLFDVDFDIGFGSNGGILAGSGDIGGIFSNATDTGEYAEGSTVSANFGGVRYDWTISYSGNITWTDADNSVVDTITGAGTGVDVVLIGLGSESVGVPGDFDDDGDVDGRDFLAWQRGNSPNGTPGVSVSAADLADWQANYGPGPLAAIGSVPEPSSLLLLCAALPLLARRSR